jgi:predicted anti-sigma-YlaC factor YlaD
MQCTQARKKLLELLDEKLDAEMRAAVEEHLGACPKCAEEYQSLQEGHNALCEVIPFLAPPECYLTSERLQTLERNIQRNRKILTLPRFVGAAAAAAILVAVLFLYQDVLRWMESPKPSPSRGQNLAVDSGRRPGSVPVRMQIGSSGQKPNVVRVMIPPEKELRATGSPSTRSRTRILRTNSPGVRVPVENTLYDPEQDGYWW